MKRGTKILLGVVGVLVGIQLIQFKHTNPPVTGDVAAPPQVEAVLRRACYDCHSNETKWPWYSRLAPVSWLVQRDVVDGRRHLNFSEWDKVPAEKRARKLRGIGREVEHDEMPPWFYLPMHAEAKLTDADRQVLKSWYAAGIPSETPPKSGATSTTTPGAPATAPTSGPSGG